MEIGFKHNIGPIDRTLRFLAALTLFGLTYFRVIHVGAPVGAILYIIAGFLFLEAVTAY